MLDKFDISKYAAYLEGHDMQKIKLNLTEYIGVVGTYGYGALIQINNDNTTLFNSLVGKCDYLITF